MPTSSSCGSKTCGLTLRPLSERLRLLQDTKLVTSSNEQKQRAKSANSSITINHHVVLGSTRKVIFCLDLLQLTDDQVERLKEHCDIENFKKNDAVNMKPPKGVVPDEVREKFNFIRKGKVGDWKNFFTNDENLKSWNEWIAENNGGNNNDESEGLIPIKYTG